MTTKSRLAKKEAEIEERRERIAAKRKILADRRDRVLTIQHTAAPGKLEFEDWEPPEGTPLHVDFGAGLKARIEVYYNDQWRKVTMYAQAPKHPRIVTLEITSWVGRGGMHIYGKLTWGALSFASTNGKHTWAGMQDKIPEQTKHGKVILTTPITDKHRKWEENCNKGFRYQDDETRTSGFFDLQSLIERAKEVFPLIFGPGWKLDLNECDESLE